MPYVVHSSGYLARAQERLKEGTHEALFYAALELRSGIESRMREYLEARADIAKRKRHGWQVAKLAKALEAVFSGGEKIVRLTGLDQDGTQLWEVYFTPVRKRLRKQAQRLGDYLHGNQRWIADDDPWWGEFRTALEETAEELAFANCGTLLGPPLLERKTGRMTMTVYGDEKQSVGAHLTRIGDRVRIDVAYLDDLPGSLLERRA